MKAMKFTTLRGAIRLECPETSSVISVVFSLLKAVVVVFVVVVVVVI